ncbi:MAG: hypothetical protein RLZZ308_93 [Candidatus Parcubacteria bacterium]|jgi:hypothetical protein
MEQQPMTTKRALIVVGITGFLIILMFIIPGEWVGVGTSTGVTKKPLILKTKEELGLLNKDTDNNNTADWKDLLNTTTNEKVRAVANTLTVTEEDKTRLNDKNNLTASLGKNLYTVSAYLQKNGTVSESDQQKLAEKLVTEEASRITVTTYTTTDITTTKDTTLLAKKTYGNALATLLKKANTYNLGDSDVAVIKEYLTSKDATLLDSLITKRVHIDEIITNLRTMPVPYSAVPYHMLLLNTISAYRTTIDGLSQADADPLRAYVAFSSLLTINKELITSMATVIHYFVLEKVTFTPQEAGYSLLQR